MRSEATSNDYATTADVLREVLSEYEKRGTEFDTMCCLYPTAPFVQVSELKEAAAMIEAGAPVIPVTSFDFPPLRGFKVAEDGSLEYAFLSTHRPAARTSRDGSRLREVLLREGRVLLRDRQLHHQ